MTQSHTLHSAHPRSRGEHSTTGPSAWLSTGSSPLARGTLGRVLIQLNNARLIPARAGNTPRDAQALPACAAHPRSRGEHCLSDEMAEDAAGSSPLARGTRVERDPWAIRDRLIPARAGNTILLQKQHVSPPAHPRSRGEHITSQTAREFLGGSSPLARGTHDGLQNPFHGLRLIPARAGNTVHLVCSRIIEAAHPRSRGEHMRHCIL